MSNIKVSVICLTYNHAPFLDECLASLVSQKTDFGYEIIVHDDASTDGTTEILRKWSEKYPDLIVPQYEEVNQFLLTNVYATRMFPAVRGEYVAFCDGDDYWIDPCKLAKQARVLDEHPDISICFHPAKILGPNGFEKKVFPTPLKRFFRSRLGFQQLLKWNFMHTNSVMYRWLFNKNNLDQVPWGVMPLDWFLHLMHAEKGDIYFLPEAMSVYRQQGQGVWSGSTLDAQWYKNWFDHQMRFYDAVEKQFGIDCAKIRYKLALSAYAHARYSNDSAWKQTMESAYFQNTSPSFPDWWNLPGFFVRECIPDVWNILSEIAFIRRLKKISKMYPPLTS